MINQGPKNDAELFGLGFGLAEGSRASFNLNIVRLNGYYLYNLKFAELNLVLTIVVGPSGPEKCERSELFYGEDEPGQIGKWAHPDLNRRSLPCQGSVIPTRP